MKKVTFEDEYLSSLKSNFEKYKIMGDKTFKQLEDEDLHFLLDKDSNSIAIIIQHISGNLISRFTDFLISDGEKPSRHRDSEFEELQLSKVELIERWNKSWSVLFDSISNLRSDDLLKTIYIRKEPLSVIDALNRSLSHTASHIGQIIFMAKHLKKSEWKTLSIPKKK
jgi:Protein of unknown function (DUF1572)